jgi:hypothetical protein
MFSFHFSVDEHICSFSATFVSSDQYKDFDKISLYFTNSVATVFSEPGL